MGTHTIPEDAPRQARYCPTCGHTAVHWGLRTTIEAMVEAHDMRPSGGVGGTRLGVKCLHAHVAFALAQPGYRLGEAVLDEVPERWPERCCSLV